MSNIPTLHQLQRGLELSERIAAHEAELAALFGGSSTTPKSAKGDGRSGKRSPETIAKMKASQQARWAKVRIISPLDTLEAGALKPAKKGGMSAAGRARVAAGQKARWAKIKGEKSGGAKANAPAPAAKAQAPAKKKRTISPEHRANLAAAAKARWAAKKAE